MSWTKRALVMQSFEEAGLAAIAYDLTPEQLESAVRRLDSMMATWASQGINLGYALSSGSDDGDLDQDSGIPTIANEAVYLNLGIRHCSSFGKTPSAVLSATAERAYKSLLPHSAQPRPVPYPSNLPRGAGNRWGRTRTFFPIPDTSPIQTDEGGGLTLGD